MTKTIRNFYAAFSPRGFQNETQIHAFRSKASRDAWVAGLDYDEYQSSGPRAVSAKFAKRMIDQYGDAATENYNSIINH